MTGTVAQQHAVGAVGVRDEQVRRVVVIGVEAADGDELRVVRAHVKVAGLVKAGEAVMYLGQDILHVEEACRNGPLLQAFQAQVQPLGLFRRRRSSSIRAHEHVPDPRAQSHDNLSFLLSFVECDLTAGMRFTAPNRTGVLVPVLFQAGISGHMGGGGVRNSPSDRV